MQLQIFELLSRQLASRPELSEALAQLNAELVNITSVSRCSVSEVLSVHAGGLLLVHAGGLSTESVHILEWILTVNVIHSVLKQWSRLDLLVHTM